MSLMFPLLLLATAASAAKIYEWKLPTIHYGIVTTQMTTLNKSLADEDPQIYVKCFKAKYNWWPNPLEYNYNKVPYGRKKRDLRKAPLYEQEIPFLVSANFEECTLRRLAIGIRKLEELTCLRFVPYQGEGKHSAKVFMIHNIVNQNPGTCNGGFGQSGAYNSVLEGKTYDALGSMSLPENGCVDAFEHEMMHVLGFVHPQDSPYREGPQAFWDKKGYSEAILQNAAITRISPWEKNSAASYMGNYLFTDWDIWKINSVYKCKTTTYGNKPIDMKNTPPPVKNDFSI